MVRIDPIGLLFQWGPIVGAGYYGYIMYTGQPSILGPNDPILKILNDVKAAIFTPAANDTTPPLLTITNPPNATHSMGPGNFTIQGNASDGVGGSGIRDVRVRINSQAWINATPYAPGNFSSWSVPVNLTAVGSYIVEAQATDNANNSSPVVGVTITVTPDGPPPCTLVCTPPQILDAPTCTCITPPTCNPPQILVNNVCVTPQVGTIIIRVGTATVADYNQFNQGDTVYVRGSGFLPGGAAGENVRIDFIVNNAILQSRTSTTRADGSFTSPFVLTASSGVGIIKVTGLTSGASGNSPTITVIGTAPVTCTAPQILQNGVCVTPPTCTPPQVLQNGVCVTPSPVTCPTGTTLINGECVQNPPSGADLIKPTISITSPANGTNTATNMVTITGTASDNVGVASVLVRPRATGSTNTAGYIAATPISPGNYSQWTVNLNLYLQGAVLGEVHVADYDIVARAEDTSGNTQFAIITIHCPSCAGTTPPPTSQCPAGQKFSNNTCESIVSTNKDQFVVNESVLITATGFTPGENVELRIRLNESTCPSGVINVQANNSGVATGTLTACEITSTGGYVMATGQSSQLVGRHSITVVAQTTTPPPTNNPGPYETTFNITTPLTTTTISAGQTYTYPVAVSPYTQIIVESNEPAAYQGDMTCQFSVNGGAFISATRVSLSNDQWRLVIPSGSWHAGAGNSLVIKFTYINGYVKQGTIMLNMTTAGLARVLYARAAYGGRAMSYKATQRRYEDSIIIAGLR